ncbi:hypothetical protein SYNPS1DRAFT_28202 [Syncephalis pseudoplumigaleata]|uniref:DUF159-domain-containing protein n=1 Tax=Syncephalis pseudoplumigaleata TaxID=1712513 RepID=A0A4P9Z298_9FUNG|nr:hypothetical protein SYNPS1DRAFT_28202 [Syncephalis pseudoplumigaleata]|eukprot:RKP26092.1 hypothetical protein SYNPS1DRAFT_28202 [Syncephalis pseudoplumigaleata]
MCGRTELGVDVEQIIARFQLYRWLHPEQFTPNYNVAPTQTQPVLTWNSSNDDDSERLIQNMEWGVTTFKEKKMIINLRDDTLRNKPSVAGHFRRCVVLARGYYEWKRRDKHSTPYYIHRADGAWMLFAGLYTIASTSADDRFTYVIVTTTAADTVAHIHDRMPVVLEDPSEWLDVKQDWRRTLHPFTGQLSAYPVSPRVNFIKYQDAECMKPLDQMAGNIKRFFPTATDPSKPEADWHSIAPIAAPSSPPPGMHAKPQPAKQGGASTRSNRRTPTKTKTTTPYTRPVTDYFKRKEGPS